MLTRIHAFLFAIFLAGVSVSPAQARVQAISTPTRKVYKQAFNDNQKQALDSSDFPIKVYISPLIEADYFTDSPDLKRTYAYLLPQSTYLSFRQGVLDWSRILLALPKEKTNDLYTIVLEDRQDPSAEEALAKLGVFKLVAHQEQADLVIKAVDLSNGGLPYYRGDILGVFSAAEDYRLGKIRMELVYHKNIVVSAAYGASHSYKKDTFPPDFFMRNIVIHELGHALGLGHVVATTNKIFDSSENQCNLMYPSTTVCVSKLPECKAQLDSQPPCISIEDQQLRRLENQIMTRVEDSPKKPYEVIKSYIEAVDQKITANLAEVGEIRDSGNLEITLSAKGEITKIEVSRSFGSEVINEKMIGVVKKFAPFGNLPESYPESYVNFTLAYAPNICIQPYEIDITRRITEKLRNLDLSIQAGEMQLKISENGELISYQTTKSFGDKKLNLQVAGVVESLAPFPALVPGVVTQELTIPFSYQPKGELSKISLSSGCAPIDWLGYIDRYTKRINANFKPEKKDVLQRIIIDFFVDRKGQITNLKVIDNTEKDNLQEPALAAIRMSSPLEALPDTYPEDKVKVRMLFYVRPDPKPTL